ncbi:MAG: hypothetical protein JRI68_11205 [Deltaproteobacteria bacterium]|nr:hypothetical protein [Deltaproteobacteria bacterium]
MKTKHVLVVLASLTLAGCPESKTPVENGPSAGTGAATTPPTAPTPPPTSDPGPTPAVALKGGWTVHATSQDPAVKATMPEEKAKALFDHYAEVREGKVQVEHKTLAKTWPLADDGKAVALDGVMTGTDWKKMKLRLSLEGAVAGGPIYTFVVDLGGEKVELQTGNPDGYPELKTILSTLKGVAGVP